jgi:hypothetical protein
VTFLAGGALGFLVWQLGERRGWYFGQKLAAMLALCVLLSLLQSVRPA